MLAAWLGHEWAMSAKSPTPGDRSGQLLGDLARQLTALVRRDVEVSAAERLPTLRRALLDTAAVAVVTLLSCLRLPPQPSRPAERLRR
jgi:hypothetical protein